jgi:hypothetical protein
MEDAVAMEFAGQAKRASARRIGWGQSATLQGVSMIAMVVVCASGKNVFVSSAFLETAVSIIVAQMTAQAMVTACRVHVNAWEQLQAPTVPFCWKTRSSRW